MSKKFLHILITVLSAAVIAACSSDAMEPAVEECGTPISFGGIMPETSSVTRADAPLESVSTSFVAYSYKNDGTSESPYSSYVPVMDGYQVRWVANSAATSTTNECDWEYILESYPMQSVKYWDWSARAYRFFGTTAVVHDRDVVADNVASEPYEPNEAHARCRISFTVDGYDPAAAPYFSRLWFSTGALPEYADKQFGHPVTLEFVKALAQVRFILVSAKPDVSLEQLELQNPSFKPVSSSKHITTVGTFTVSYPLTTSPGVRESWTVTPIDYVIALTKRWETDADWRYVLPSLDQGAYRLTVRVNGQEKTCTVPAELMVWQPGYEYTYVFKIDGDLGVTLGEVNSVYTNWQVGKDADYTIYNW